MHRRRAYRYDQAMTDNTAIDDEMHEQRERQYEQRNESIRHAIDVLASHDRAEIEQYGMKTRIAEENDMDVRQVHYVLDNWGDLVKWRRRMNSDPLDPSAVKEAYDDETMQAMAEQTVVADGIGDVTVPIELGLDECFRAVKLLPGDLGMKVFTQLLEHSDDLPRDRLHDLLQRRD